MHRTIHRWKSAALCLSILAAVQSAAFAVNPFLKPAEKESPAVTFSGVEWNDENGPKDTPLTAKVTTKEVAKTAWGGVFKISFEDLQSAAGQKREIGPLYFVVTDDVIALLNEEKMDEAIQKIAALDNPPEFEPADIYGVTKGVKKLSDARTKTTVTAKGDTCTYLYSHESGHFTKVVWRKGAGLVDYEQGRGAHQDGFRLKAGAPAKSAH